MRKPLAAACLVPVLALSACAGLVPKKEHVSYARGGASTRPLVSDDDFAASMQDYPLLLRSGMFQEPLPGLQGAYGLRPRFGSDEYDLGVSREYTPQGMTVGDGRIFVSAYDHDQEQNSVIFVLDARGNYLKTIGLDNTAHVGGLGYDIDRHLLWVADSDDGRAVISAISQDAIDEYDITTEAPVEYALSLYVDSLPAASVLDFYQDELWLGYFTTDADRAQLQVFSLDFSEPDEDGSIDLVDVGPPNSATEVDGKVHVVPDIAFRAPSMIQGLAVADDHLYIAQSFGAKHDSRLTRYDFDITDTSITLKNGRTAKLPPYVEQITLGYYDDEPYIFPLFESTQPTYRAKTDKIVDRILAIPESEFEQEAKAEKKAPVLTEIPVQGG